MGALSPVPMNRFFSSLFCRALPSPHCFCLRLIVEVQLNERIIKSNYNNRPSKLMFNYQFAQFYHSCDNNYQTYMSEGLYYCIRNGLIQLKISTQKTRSFIVQVPLNWQINKIKCIIANKIPTLDFKYFHLTHDNLRLPGSSTIQNAIELDHFQDCRYSQHYQLSVVPNQNETNQFDNYYSQKIGELLYPIHGSPFQPILHQRYNLLLQILEIKESLKIKSISKIRTQMLRLSNFKQIRQELVIEEARWRQERLQRRQENNHGIHMIIMNAFSIIQMICFGYILGILLNFMRLQHYAVIGVILLLIGLIQLMRKSNQRPQEPTNPTQQKSQSQTTNDSDEGLQVHQRYHHNKQQTILRIRLWLTVKIWLIMKTCLLVEIVISFMLSLFPNWTMQTHLNFFRTTYSKIQRKINSWKQYISEQAPNLVDDDTNHNQPE